MAGKGKAFTTIVKWGVKYGPIAYEAAKHGKEPAKAAAQKAFGRVQAYRSAVEHGLTVVEGSVLKTFDQQGDPVWVVFSGDEPVATHPATATPMADLLQHADLTKRVRAVDAKRPGEAVRRLAPKRRGRQGR